MSDDSEYLAMRASFVLVAERLIEWQRAAWRANRMFDQYLTILDRMTPIVRAAKPVISDYQI